MLKQLFSFKIVKNFSVLTGTNLLIQFLSILSSIRLARLLLPEGYGLYNLLLVQAGFFSIIAVYGLKLVVIRVVARNKENSKKVFIISNHIRLFTTAIAVICLFAYNLFINEVNISFFLLLLLAIFICFNSFWDSIESISFGNELMGSSGLISLVFTALWVIIVYIIPKVYFSILILFTVFCAIQIVKTISYYWWLNKIIFKGEIQVLFNKDLNYKLLISQSNYYFVLAIGTAFQNQFPLLVLNQNSTLDQVGIFNLGFRILSPLQMVLVLALTSLYPSLSRLSYENKELFTKRIKNLLNLMVIIGVWGCICFTLFSKEVVLFLYGKAYLDSAKVILIQCWYTILFGIFSTIGTVLSSYDKQKKLAILSVIGGIISLPISFWGSKYGAIGLAWAFVITAYINMTYHWIVFKSILTPYLTFSYSFVIFSILITATICSLFLPFEISLIPKIILGTLITFTVGYYLKNIELKKILSSEVL
jgi:O-antigen/teichoic acid export membrane protein